MNTYDMTSGKVKPATMKGFVELAEVCSKNFAKIFIELPDVVGGDGLNYITAGSNIDKERVLDWIEKQK
jgi:hypothetical protein